MSKIARKKPIILTLETSGRTGSAALAAAEELIADKTFSTPVRHSSEIFPAITGLLQAAGLGPSDVEHIYITTGPGSFTGLRIAAAFAKIMNLANNNIKIIAVDTLDCIAANIIDFQKQTKAEVKKVAAILDAKRGEFFTAVYERAKVASHKSQVASHKSQVISHKSQVTSDGDSGFAPPMAGWEKTIDDCLLTPAQFIEKFADADEPVWLLGEGLVFYRKNFEAKGIEFVDEKFWQPSASQVHNLGYRLALAGKFADPLSLVPKYLQRPDIGGL